MKQLTLSQAIEGFLLEKQAQHLSPHTVAAYTNAFLKLQACLGTDVPLASSADKRKPILYETCWSSLDSRSLTFADQGRSNL